MILIHNVPFVKNNLGKIGMQNVSAVPCHVQPSFVGVKDVKKKPNEDVFCLVTKKNGNFIANGIVVKNCDALRYAIYTHFFNKDTRRMSAIELDNSWREALGGEKTVPDVFQQPNEFGY